MALGLIHLLGPNKHLDTILDRNLLLVGTLQLAPDPLRALVHLSHQHMECAEALLVSFIYVWDS